MVQATRARWVALVAGIAVGLPAAAAHASSGNPVAGAAGGGAAPLNPSVVGVPIQRTDAALAGAADAIDAGDGAGAAAKLTASRRYLLRSYSGARYLIANQPPPAASAAGASPKKFVKLAKRAIKAARIRAAGGRRSVIAGTSGGAVGPAFADAPTAVFNVLTSQYSAATAAVGMAPDATGQLLAKAKTTLDTAIILRNRLVQIIYAAAPPVAAAGIKAHSAQADVTTFDVVMPGLTVLIDDELQLMNAASADPSVPAEAKAVLTDAIAADTQVEALVNQYWPPVPADA
ncbi:MAG: hypothetical protein JWR30_3505 [Conexibacter sp.]|nr:hypothetical protein [Conexibacter sp.]